MAASGIRLAGDVIGAGQRMAKSAWARRLASERGRIMSHRSVLVAVSLSGLVACGVDGGVGESEGPGSARYGAAPSANDGPATPPAPVGSDGGAPPADAAPSEPPLTFDPALEARLLRMIASVTGDQYQAYAWSDLIAVRQKFEGRHFWVPGTGEWTRDDAIHGRAMAAVPSGLASWGPARDISATTSQDTAAWLGVFCSQSEGGPEWNKLGTLSALEVFATAWRDAKDIVARHGAALRGAWLTGHSAGALPALLAGLVGGAHRIDVYGVPSAVSTLDGDDGIVHVHTHVLDPAGTMGFIDPFGRAQLDPLGAAATAIKAGESMKYHDYSAWPSPMP
jgi:hypothetical protein